MMDTNKFSIMILDDEPTIVKTLKIMLSLDYNVHGFTEVEEAKKCLADEKIELTLLDYRLNGADGLEVLSDFKKEYPAMEVIMITGFGEIETAVRAIKGGAFHFLAKPFETNVLRNLIKNAIEKQDFENQTKNLKNLVNQKYNINNLIGSSKKMQNLREIIKKAQQVDSNVLLIGENGTGKELAARIIHAGSKHNGAPFVPLISDATMEEMLESTLFGHTKGAFTGAVSDKIGLFESAGNGTIFLDEISEMPMEMQAKLSRVIESREFTPIGGTKSKKTFARIIASTNKTESELQNAKAVREDLYYRLNVLPIITPPLRERIEDMEELCKYFLIRYATKLNKNIRSFHPETIEKLKSYSWPGNVRQLENVIERVVILEDGSEITVKHLPPEISNVRQLGATLNIDSPYRDYMKNSNDIAGNRYIQSLLKKTGGNVTKASAIAGITRESFHRLMKKTSKLT